MTTSQPNPKKDFHELVLAELDDDLLACETKRFTLQDHVQLQILRNTWAIRHLLSDILKDTRRINDAT